MKKQTNMTASRDYKRLAGYSLLLELTERLTKTYRSSQRISNRYEALSTINIILLIQFFYLGAEQIFCCKNLKGDHVWRTTERICLDAEIINYLMAVTALNTKPKQLSWIEGCTLIVLLSMKQQLHYMRLVTYFWIGLYGRMYIIGMMSFKKSLLKY